MARINLLDTRTTSFGDLIGNGKIYRVPPFQRDASENRPYIRELELFRVKQAYPTLFAAYEKFSPENFTRLLKLVCVLFFSIYRC